MTRTEPGAAEYQALTDAFEHTAPRCRDDWRYIQERDTLDADDLEAMGYICRTACPLYDLCSAYATVARPKGGMWAGRYYGNARTRE